MAGSKGSTWSAVIRLSRPKRGDEPRNAGIGQGAVRRFRQQHVEIAPGAAEPAREWLVGRRHAGHEVLMRFIVVAAPAQDLDETQ